MLDGRHTGTGGGNHFVLGGATPADSPFLRRPDLLRSLVSYWHNHPSLSYLFSGLFIGPTSQAPRVDEARNDSVYELEIAFRRCPEDRAQVPALADRPPAAQPADRRHRQHAPRRVLHRQAVQPDSATGRLGLLELRAFEMPPHARMSLAQQLLLRALIARFWQQPYAPPRCGAGAPSCTTASCCRTSWRRTSATSSTSCASSATRSISTGSRRTSSSASRGTASSPRAACEVELRMALEPWHVMGEEGAPGGTVRYVDSSVERLQVKVPGSTTTATC
jgi:uncharacterized protein (DUF2126 family)